MVCDVYYATLIATYESQKAKVRKTNDIRELAQVTGALKSGDQFLQRNRFSELKSGSSDLTYQRTPKSTRGLLSAIHPDPATQGEYRSYRLCSRILWQFCVLIILIRCRISNRTLGK